MIDRYLDAQWRRDFQATLPLAADAYSGKDTAKGDFESRYKPTKHEKRLSCQL